MAAFVIAFLVWCFATDNLSVWLSLAKAKPETESKT